MSNFQFLHKEWPAINDQGISGVFNNDTALDTLHCSSNQLTSLDVSNNTSLTYLNCGGNQLTILDVSKNTALTYLWCRIRD